MYTPEALGDYMAGPNHVLPTGGTARFASPLGVYDFVKRTSILSFSREALERYGRPTARFAGMEGLDGHGAIGSPQAEKPRRLESSRRMLVVFDKYSRLNV